jgi:hypothetical protein
MSDATESSLPFFLRSAAFISEPAEEPYGGKEIGAGGGEDGLDDVPKTRCHDFLQEDDLLPEYGSQLFYRLFLLKPVLTSNVLPRYGSGQGPKCG